MIRDTHLRPIRLAALAAAVLLMVPARAGADGERRIVVAEFEGPLPSSKLVRDALIEIVSDFYEVLPYSKYRVARRRLNVTRESIRTFAQVARRVGADAIIEAQLNGRDLVVSVREGGSGRVIDRFKVKVQPRGFSEETRERITDELVDLIDSTEPLKGDIDRLGGPRTAVLGETGDGEATPASLTAPGQPPPPAVIKKRWVGRLEGPTAPKKKTRPSPIQLSASVGVAATARQLAFSHQPDLAEDERPLGMSGSPSAGVAFAGTFDLEPLGISTEAIFKRSIGASVSYPAAGMTKQVGITLSHIGARLMMRHQFGHRVTARGGAGYHQLAFRITKRPNGLLIPDARYAFADVTAGARLNLLRDDRLALTADLSYLHVLTAGGITDSTAYGTSRFQGYGGEVGLEVQVSDTTFVRLAGTYERIILGFNGDGALTTGLDESGDVDVSGAADTFIGWAAMLGFRL